MKKYTIELIQCINVWFPMKEKITVNACNLQEALEAVIGNETEFYEEDVEELEEDCKEQWGYTKKSNEFWALVYNQILDQNECEKRILRGYCNGRKCFDLVGDQGESEI